MLAGQAAFGLALLAQCLPDLGCFVAYPSWLQRAQVFPTCEWSPACQRVTGTGKTVLAVFLSTWELAAKGAEGTGCFLDWLLWRDALQTLGVLGPTLPGPKGPKFSYLVSGLQPGRGSQGLQKLL